MFWPGALEVFLDWEGYADLEGKLLSGSFRVTAQVSGLEHHNSNFAVRGIRELGIARANGPGRLVLHGNHSKSPVLKLGGWHWVRRVLISDQQSLLTLLRHFGPGSKLIAYAIDDFEHWAKSQPFTLGNLEWNEPEVLGSDSYGRLLTSTG